MMAAAVTPTTGETNLRPIGNEQTMFGLTGKLPHEVFVKSQTGPFTLTINGEYVFHSLQEDDDYVVEGNFSGDVTSFRYVSESGMGFVTMPVDVGTFICGEVEARIVKDWRDHKNWYDQTVKFAQVTVEYLIYGLAIFIMSLLISSFLTNMMNRP